MVVTKLIYILDTLGNSAWRREAMIVEGGAPGGSGQQYYSIIASNTFSRQQLVLQENRKLNYLKVLLCFAKWNIHVEHDP